MDGDLLIIIGELEYDHADMELLAPYGIGAVMYLDKNKVDNALLGQDASSYLDELHEEIHRIRG